MPSGYALVIPAVKHLGQFAVLRKLCDSGRMTHVNDPFRTPGQLIEALLKERGWSKRILAIVLDLDETGINRLASDKRSVDAKMAVSLEEVFNVPAERFLELQKSYDLAKARIEARPDPKRATRAALYGGLPVAEMIKRGWIDAHNVRDTATVEASLSRFFGVNRIEDVEVLPHNAKKTHVNTDATPAQLAWLYRVRKIASESLVGRYSPEAVVSAIERIRNLLSSAEELRKVPRIMAEAGIRFVIVEALPSSKIDGVCFWLNERSPVIALSMRYDRIDNFCFVLRHEMEHVKQRDGLANMMLDAELEGERAGQSENIPLEERRANAAAAEFCVPQKMMDAFIARKSPFFAERDILGFANTIKVHPGLVAGQLQHRTGQYNKFRNHLVKVRSIVAPSAIVDGWGDVAPVDS